MNVVSRALGRTAGASSIVRASVLRARHVGTPLRTAVAYSTVSTGSPPVDELKQLVEDIWSSNDFASIHRSCSALASQIETGNTPPLVASSDNSRIRGVLRTLAKSGSTQDVDRIAQILQHVYPALGLNPTKRDYSFILRHLLDRENGQQALNLLQDMEKLPGGFKPEIGQFHAFLASCSKFSDFEFLQNAVNTLPQMGLEPSNQTFFILLQSRWDISRRDDSTPGVEDLTTLVRWCAKRGMTSDPSIATLLYQNYADVQRPDLALQMMSVYESATRPVEDLDGLIAGGEPSAADKIPAASDRARYLLRGATSYSDITNVAQSLNISCKADHHLIVINNCITAEKYPEAFEIYYQSKQAGVTPTAPMLAPLFEVLYRGNYLAASNEAIDTAMELYKHLADAWPASLDGGEGTPAEASINGPNSALYRALVRMALFSPDVQKYSAIADSLIFDMELRGLPSNTSFFAASKVILEMRRVGSFSKAIEFYREQRDYLGEAGYIDILREYCRISFAGDLEVPLITEYFSIVNHMRLRRIPVTGRVYTIILHRIGVLATRIRRNGMSDGLMTHGIHKRLVDTTRRIHNFLTLDAAITPNAALWNQLMNTYQRLLLFNDAQKLWQTMHLTGRYDQRSVNIMLDATGYTGQLRVGRALIVKLEKSGYGLDLQNWNTWIEALCRNQHFDEAEDVIYSRMQKGTTETKPNIETIRIFCKFAKKHSWWKKYRPRLEKNFPELLNSLEHKIENS